MISREKKSFLPGTFGLDKLQLSSYYERIPKMFYFFRAFSLFITEISSIL